MIRILAAFLAVVLSIATFWSVVAFLTGTGQNWQVPQSIVVTATSIERLSTADGDVLTTQGRLRFAGGLVLRSPNPHFGALSGMRIDENGQLFAVTDTGFWFSGSIQRDSAGKPSGISKTRMAPLLDSAGRPFTQKWYGDAEALEITGKSAFVSTEQNARILRYDIAGDILFAASQSVGPGLPGPPLDTNFGLEALAAFPTGSRFDGRLLAVAEAPKLLGDQIRGFIFNDTEIAEFSLLQRDGFYVTDADFLPSGDLLLLERRFSPFSGAAMRLRRISDGDIEPGALLDGTVLLTLDDRFTIDNMEGLSAIAMPDGGARIALISDDNKWPLQRTLYLEFELANQAAALRSAMKR